VFLSLSCGANTAGPQVITIAFELMCSGSEAGSYLRLIDFVYHSTQVITMADVGDSKVVTDIAGAPAGANHTP